jgi:hypothetical protein
MCEYEKNTKLAVKINGRIKALTTLHYINITTNPLKELNMH